MNQTTFFQLQSTLILLILWLGVLVYRKKTKIHIRMQATGMIWDVLLILQIELTRSAINKASKVMSNPWLLNIHVLMAVSCVVLYGFLVWSGLKRLKGNGSLKLHKSLGYTTLTLRTLVYITSYLIK